MDDYNQLLKKTLDLRSKREDKFKDMSKNRLYEISRKKIQTTMIGALDSIEKSFGFEPEITAKLAKKKLKFFEVGISYQGRTYEEGKKIRPIDGLKALICIIKYNLFS